VIGDGAAKKGRRGGCQQQTGEIQPALGMAEPHEANGEGQRQQETEEYLYPQTCNPQLLEQFAKVAVVTLGLGFVATGVVLGPCGLIVVGHRSAPNSWRLS